MSIFDFNLHLYSKEKGTLDSQLRSNTELTAADLTRNFNGYKSHFTSSGISSGNFMLFNQNILSDEGLGSFFETVRTVFPQSVFTLLFNFHFERPFEQLETAKGLGFRFIKFHSYTQQILPADFEKIVEISKYAEQLGLGICIDASFGTTGLYKYDNLKLAAEIADHVRKAPIVLLHSGGSRVLDAMLIADLCHNIYMETSLSLHYYERASIYRDFAFAYKKIGLHRILYASDFPYQKADDAIKTFTAFCEMHQISDKDKENIMFHNAMNLVHG